jgi:hypothetical protein
MDQHQFDVLIKALDATKWTELVSTAILVLSFVIAIITLLYARRQVLEARNQLLEAHNELLADHHRSQRQLATEMCLRWSDFISPETASVTRLVEKLNEHQCDSIVHFESLSIPVENKTYLLNIFQLRFPGFDNTLETFKQANEYVLKDQYVFYLRHIAVRYLNMLESILTTWTRGIADQTMIELEFAYLLDEEKGRSAMDTLRGKLGREGFPAIEAFMDALREKKDKNLAEIKRPPIVP